MSVWYLDAIAFELSYELSYKLSYKDLGLMVSFRYGTEL